VKLIAFALVALALLAAGCGGQAETKTTCRQVYVGPLPQPPDAPLTTICTTK
jgi:hypothetical protein